MTRILTIIALLVATPSWAMSSEQIILEGEILASSGSRNTNLVVSYKGKIYYCEVSAVNILCVKPE